MGREKEKKYMCLAVPRKIIQIVDNRALLNDRRWVRLDLVPHLKVGDMIIVSADLAVEKVSPEQAFAMKQVMSE